MRGSAGWEEGGGEVNVIFAGYECRCPLGDLFPILPPVGRFGDSEPQRGYDAAAERERRHLQYLRGAVGIESAVEVGSDTLPDRQRGMAGGRVRAETKGAVVESDFG